MKQHFNLIVAINIAALMALMDLSAVNIALPTIKTHFNLSVSEVSLILMATMFMSSATALIMGKMLGRISPGRLLSAAFVVYGFTTTLTAFAPDFYWMIPLRLIQGVAESALYVTGPALIKNYISPQWHQKEYGRWMMSTGIGICLGPIIGAILIDLWDWPAVFLINLPLAMAGLYFSLKLDKSISFTKVHNSFDVRGAWLSFVFLGSMILFFNIITKFGVLVEWLVPLSLAAVVFLYLFVRHENSVKEPLLDLKLFKINNFRQANLGFFLFFVINVGGRFIHPFYFEETRSLSTTASGVMMMIAPGVMLFVSLYIDKLERYFITRQLVIGGNILLTISMIMFAMSSEKTNLGFLIAGLIILGISMGLYYPATTQAGMKGLPNGSHGMGSASISVSKSLGKLMGVLMFGLLFQFFFNYFFDAAMGAQMLKSIAIQWVFFMAAVLSFLNTLYSTRLK